MKEYEFRFPSLHAIDLRDHENNRRVELVRRTIVSITGAFTEIPENTLKDLIPGDGLGYIVATKSRSSARHLQEALSYLAQAWNLPTLKMTEASKGPRSNFCFFIIPELSNLSNADDPSKLRGSRLLGPRLT